MKTTTVALLTQYACVSNATFLVHIPLRAQAGESRHPYHMTYDFPARIFLHTLPNIVGCSLALLFAQQPGIQSMTAEITLAKR